MKQLKSTFLLTVLMSMVGLQAFADWDTSTKVQVGDLYYYLDNKNSQAQVTSMPSGKYTGSITIPSSVSYNEKAYSVTSISNYAFYVCSTLTTVTIPNSVTSIGNSAFQGCSALTSITIPNSVTSIGKSAFEYCEGLTSVNIPNSVSSIGNYAFRNCTSLTSVIIGNSVTSIGREAFARCSGLTSVTIPNSVTNIGDYAFNACSGLISVTVDIINPLEITENTFANCVNATLYVPAGCKAAYEAADYWKEFKEIVEMEAPNIVFADTNVKALCMANWDTNGDGELSKAEAAAVTKLGEVFYGKAITSFNELQYFTGLTYIDSFAFKDCSGLTSINIPNSVTSIGAYAFFGCYGLTSVTIPNSVTSIGMDAFSHCSGLTSVTIGNSVTSIESSAFFDCPSLTSIIVESGNTKYDSRDNCNAIIETESNTLIIGCKNTTIPNSVTSIGSYAFVGCFGLTSITIPNSVTSIGGFAFSSSGLTSITIPNSVTSIGKGAFSDCTGLTSVTIPNSVTSIGEYAFYNCSALTSVTIESETPVTITSTVFSNRANATLYVPYGCKAAYEATDYWKDFKEIIEMAAPSPTIAFADTNVKALCVANWDTNGDGELSEAEAAAVSSLGEVFSSNQSITSFNELKYFTGITMIADYAFSSCTNLSEITIPENVVSIGSAAFNACYKLTDVVLPNNITSIGTEAFYACITLQTISLPSELKNIEGNAFLSCNRLTQILLPEGLEKIGQCAFQNCNSLTTLHIPGSVRTIGYAAFSSCTSLESVSFDEGITELGGEVFSGCEKLQSVLLPSTLTQIASGIFSMCTSLEEIHLPNGITGVASDTFHWCGNLKTVNIPESAEFIGINAFGECTSLKEIVIPQGVNEILYSAFSNCHGLEKVTSYINTPFKIDNSVFWNYDENEGKSVFSSAVLYVPKGTKTAYQDTKGWKEFKKIVEMGGGEDIDDTDIALLDNTVYVNQTEVFTGNEATLSIRMKNNVAIRGFQFDMYLPEGITPMKNSKGRILATLTNDRLEEDDEHTLTSSEQPDGAIRFLCGSQYEETFTGNDGEVFTLKVSVAEDMEDGDYPLLMKNIKLSENNISNYYEVELVKTTLSVSSYTPGDINADGKIDVSDYIGVANHILGHTPEGFVMRAGDVDDSGAIDVSDYLGIGNIIHTGSVYGSNRAMGARASVEPSDLTTMDNVVYVLSETAEPGEDMTLSLCMKNTAAIRGFQFDLYLPEGVTVKKNSKGRILATLNKARLEEDDEHTLTTSEQPDGAIRFLCGSQYEETFTGTDGEVATLQVTVSSDMVTGDYPVILRDMKLSENDIRNFYETEQVVTMLTIPNTTGISSVHRATSADERYYNLAGQRIEHPKKGLYIKDNRKVIIK